MVLYCDNVLCCKVLGFSQHDFLAAFCLFEKKTFPYFYAALTISFELMGPPKVGIFGKC